VVVLEVVMSGGRCDLPPQPPSAGKTATATAAIIAPNRRARALGREAQETRETRETRIFVEGPILEAGRDL
jgi:hypothetical protein